MQSANKIAQTLALRIGLLELTIVLVALIFVRKEIYLHGQFNAMFLQWQEYAVLVMIFLDGACRGFAECMDNGKYLSPFRKRSLRFLLPLTLFLFVACASLCDKVNMAAIHQQWWRDVGVLILAIGVFVSIKELKTRPKGLEIASSDSAIFALHNSFVSGDSNAAAAQEPGDGSGVSCNTITNTITTADNNTVTFQATTYGAGNNEDHGGTSNSVVGTSKSIEASTSNEPADEAAGDAKGEAKGEAAATRLATAIVNPSSRPDIVAEGPWKIIRYPDRSAILLELVGISMALASWLPLLTLPGLVVAFKWEIADLEAFRIRKLGEKYLNYKKETWFLIPYIY